ncbi:acyl carrier protein [Saccharothrix longispora]|uniref:acyl carrier protein n=1 Tax=Saccharothrix longispora TaxID=33920 RepID=UPI0028FD2DA9|nr:acyl carrier protein [Saccharothrix longispora]MDU0287720.1 acyl carrier protein [Saccharothrix longispora]
MSEPQTTDGVDLGDPDARLAVVRATWCEVLGVAQVPDDATFFDSGGDSLRLVVLVEKLNLATGRSLRAVDLFRAGTVRGHAELLAAPAQDRSSAFRGTGREHLLAAARAKRGVPERPR